MAAAEEDAEGQGEAEPGDYRAEGALGAAVADADVQDIVAAIRVHAEGQGAAAEGEGEGEGDEAVAPRGDAREDGDGMDVVLGYNMDASLRYVRSLLVYAVLLMILSVALAVLFVLDPPCREATESPACFVSHMESFMDRAADPCEDFYRYMCGSYIERNRKRLGESSAGYLYGWGSVWHSVRSTVNEVLSLRTSAMATFERGCLAENVSDAADWREKVRWLLGPVANAASVNELFDIVGQLQHEGRAANAFLTPRVVQVADIPARGGLQSYVYLQPHDPLPAYDETSRSALKLMADLMQDAGIVANSTLALQELLAFQEPWPGNRSNSRPPFTGPAVRLRGVDASLCHLPHPAVQRVEVVPAPALAREYLPALHTYLHAVSPPLSSELVVAGPSWVFEWIASAPSQFPVWRTATLFHVLHDALDFLPVAAARRAADMLGNRRAPFFHLDDRDDALIPPQGVLSSAFPRLPMSPPFTHAGRCEFERLSAWRLTMEHEFLRRLASNESYLVAQRLAKLVHDKAIARLETTPWLRNETDRQRVIDKVRDIHFNVPSPDLYSQASEPAVSGDAWTDYLALREQSRKTQLFIYSIRGSWRGFPAGRFAMPQWETDAFYSTVRNAVNLMAAGISPPMLTPTLPLFLSLQAYGAVIAHEVGHALGPNAAGVDAAPLLLGNDSRAALHSSSVCLDALYSSYVEGGFNVSGSRTLFENLADFAGLSFAYEAAARLVPLSNRDFAEAYTNEQLFFMAFATVNCAVFPETELRERIQRNPHSLPVHRVRGPLSNFPPFARAFNCGPSTPYGRSLTDRRCELW